MEDYRIEETAPSTNKASPQLNCKILYVSGFRGTTFQAFNNDAAAPPSHETHVRNRNTRRSYVASGESQDREYNTPPNVASGGTNNATKNEEDIRNNGALYDDAVQGDLEMTERLVKEDNKVCIYPLNDKLQNVFHIISKREEEEEDERVVEKLENIVSNMSVDDLGKKDGDGRNALHVTALYGNTKMAQVFISKNCHLLFESDGHHDLPVHLAARNIRHSQAVYTFFFNVTRQKCEEVQMPPANPFELSSAMQLFCYLIGSKFYDLALDLVVKYDELGVSVAEIPGSKLDEKNPDVASHPLLKSKTSALQALVQFDCPIINTSHLSFWNNSISYLWQPKSMTSKMSMHRKAEKLLHHLCNKLKSLKDHKQVVAIAKSAMFEAARLDMDTVVGSILGACPAIVYCLDDNKCSVFHIAVENRSENVFNLLCQKSAQMRDLAEMVDVHGNGVLHLAGKLAPPHKLNSVSGAALQMQLELQWFEEVQKVVPSYVPSTTNNDLKTPRSVFTEEHKSLKENGEKLMKDTANSCTIAAALIVTVAFAAAITVPGGNNSDSGHPIFSKKTAFTVFAVANAGSLFTASTSMLAFLSILTSRYAEKDFLLALPRRSIIGLLTLFLSIIFTMTAFSATVYLVFGQNQSAIAVGVAVLACLPVSSFVLLQFPLIVALVSSTYGLGIFRKTKRSTSNSRPKESEAQPTDIETGSKIMY